MESRKANGQEQAEVARARFSIHFLKQSEVFEEHDQDKIFEDVHHESPKQEKESSRNKPDEISS